MMKNKLTPLIIAISSYAFAQTGNVGINTSTPAATLDVVGQPTQTTKLDGLIAPRITGDQLHAKTYTASQNGAMVYVTAPAAAANLSGQTVNVASTGYYYFDGNTGLWVYLPTAANEPWLNFATATPATSPMQSLYTMQMVSIGQRNNNALLNVYNNSSIANHPLALFTFPENANETWLALEGNVSGGSFSMLTAKGDIPIIFKANRGSNYSQNGLLFAPNSDNQHYYGLKITDQGKIAINNPTPTETLDVAGTARLRLLPLNGTGKVFTSTDGTTSTQPAPINADNNFVATRTVVADNNGVLGYVSGLPKTSATPPADNTGTGIVGTPISLGVSSTNFVPSLIVFNPGSSGMAVGYSFTKDASGNWVLNFTSENTGTKVAYDVLWLTR